MGVAGVGRSIEDVSATIRSMYRAIGNRDAACLEEIVAPDALVLTPESNGVFTGAGPTAAHLSEGLDRWRDHSISVRSTDLRVATTENGADAWVSDQITVQGDTGSALRLRMTAALSWDGSHWRVSAGHCSIPLPNDETRALVEAGRLPPGVELRPTVAPDAQPLVELLDDCLSDPSLFVEVCSTRADTTAFGSAAEEVFYDLGVKQAWQEFIGFEPRMRRRGGVAAGVSESGELGWLAAHIDISFDIARPYRFFIIYARADARWEMVSIHDSVSSDMLPETQFEEQTKRAAEKAGEQLAVEGAVGGLRSWHGLGHAPTEMPHNNPGYDIESLANGHLDFIEVKGRIAGAQTFHVTRTEPQNVLALLVESDSLLSSAAGTQQRVRRVDDAIRLVGCEPGLVCVPSPRAHHAAG